MGQMVQVYTGTYSAQLGSQTMVTPVNTTIDTAGAYSRSCPGRKIMTTTKPASNPGAGSVVIGSGVSYTKIMPFIKLASGTQTGAAFAIAVWGWHYNPDFKVWVPHLIYGRQTQVPSANDVSSPFNHPKFGNVVHFQGNSGNTSSPFSSTIGIDGKALGQMNILVDCFGCELIEVEFAQTGAVDTFNFHYSTL